MQNKYKDVTLGTVEAVFNKLGGMEGVESFLRGSMEVTAVKRTIDLAKPPQLLPDSTEVVKHVGKGVVEIELRPDDNLYIDGKKVAIHLSERQMGYKRVVGHELRREIENGEQELLNVNVLDCLYDHPELFPEHWKKDGNGDIRFVFFWGSVFWDTLGGNLYVQDLHWRDGGLYRNTRLLGHNWDCMDPYVSIASN